MHKSLAYFGAISLIFLVTSCRFHGNSSAVVPVEEEPVPEIVDTIPQFAINEISETVKARISGHSYPEDCTIPLEDLRYLNVMYVDFEGVNQHGEIICNKSIAEDLIDIFSKLYEAEYQINSIKLIDEFGSDNASMIADNTSCFNYRRGNHLLTLSAHAYGMAIDINPFENPWVKDGKVEPAEAAEYADRENRRPHMIERDDLVYTLFTEHGFSWGGRWNRLHDYQHFEKRNALP